MKTDDSSIFEAISDLLKKGYSGKQIEKILNFNIADIDSEQLLEKLSKLEGEKLFNESYYD